MTKKTIDLHALVGKPADGDFLREMISVAALQLMELELGGLTRAAYGQKDAERLAQWISGPGRGDAGRHGRTAHPLNPMIAW